MYQKILVILEITLSFSIHFSVQSCPEEVSNKTGIHVTWSESASGTVVPSKPPCYIDNQMVRRYCNATQWIPPLDEIQECSGATKVINITSCPPGFYKLSTEKNEYCYKISEPTSWNYPCFKTGGATILTDLNATEIKMLLDSLMEKNISRYFWLPAQRQKLFNPVVWYIPGPNWGRQVNNVNNGLSFLKPSIVKNCLLLDIEEKTISTAQCTKIYPSLCLYLNDVLNFPAKCPKGYHGFRFLPNYGACFGIEKVRSELNLSYEEFRINQCPKPMGERGNVNLRRFVFKKIADLHNLNNVWCWYSSFFNFQNVTSSFVNNEINLNKVPILGEAINEYGSLMLMNTETPLPCMACETDMTYYNETTLLLNYEIDDSKLYLTIYFPSGLWKYVDSDKGVQCFSDGKGFLRIVEVGNEPYIEVTDNNDEKVEKIVYDLNLITDRTAQYWCEGHMKNFSLISSNKMIVNPRGNKMHVFSAVLRVFQANNMEEDKIEQLMSLLYNLTEVLTVEKVLLMDIFSYTSDNVMILVHLHANLNETFKDEASDIMNTYNLIKQKTETVLPKFNVSFINMTSAIYCLPTTSVGTPKLDWELTAIGRTTAPKQFCLKSNGLPVTRQCHGNYHMGGIWGDVEGQCDNSIEPSETTKFLYNFVKGNTNDLIATRFITKGLNFVLSDVEVIIPADIYYLSMSLQHVITVAKENNSAVEIGDIENIAWVMNRVMLLDKNNLHLAQTLNSTNAILDSVDNVIDLVTQNTTHDVVRIVNREKLIPSQDKSYEVVVEPLFVVQISYPEFNNVSGIAITKRNNSYYFTDMKIQALYKNTTLEYVLQIENLEIAAWIPEKVLNNLNKHKNYSYYGNSDHVNYHDVRVVINVYYNDIIFQQLDETNRTINSRIIGLSIPGFSSNLKYPIPLVFRELSKTKNVEKFCGYWDFQSTGLGRNPGHWASHGCYFVRSSNNMTVCKCYHMTHFGQLAGVGGLLWSGQRPYKKTHEKALNIITLVGCILSLFGVAGIWVTALVFGTWRKKAGTKLLLQLSTSIAMPLIFIVVFNLDHTIFKTVDDKIVVANNKKIVCIILGAALHYSILSNFMWMLITAVLQFIRYVRVLGVRRPSRFMIKFMLFGWGIPLIPVIILMSLNMDSYIPDPIDSGTGKKGICYPKGLNLIICVLVPLTIILIVNVSLFITVIVSISRGPDGKLRATDIDLVGAQLRVSIFLFFLLGLTWIFGIFSFFSSLLWSYLFCLTSSLQGFVVFIYFVICDPTTRNLWMTLMKPQFSTPSTRQSVVSISSG